MQYEEPQKPLKYKALGFFFGTHEYAQILCYTVNFTVRFTVQRPYRETRTVNMKLTDAKIRNAKPLEKAYKLADGKGMYLLIKPTGAKLWRLDYSFVGKRNTHHIGSYPEVSLSEAREQLEKLKKLLSKNVDINANKKREKLAFELSQATTFEEVARNWFLVNKSSWVDSHSDRIIRRLERDCFPWIGAMPIEALDTPSVLQVLRRIERRGAIETAHRCLENIVKIFAFAIGEGKCTRNVAADIKHVLQKPQKTNFAAVTKPADVAGLLKQIDGYQGTFSVLCALKLAPLVFVRPGELRQAKWSDVDLEANTWSYSAYKTKQPHIVPLSKQAKAILLELYPLTQYSEYLFPSVRDMRRPMSDNTINAAFRRMGIEKDVMSAHGFRAMARTLLEEELKFPKHIIEHQLAHAVRDANGTAYNRTTMLPERREMMQQWADYLDKLRKPADVINLPLAQNSDF